MAQSTDRSQQTTLGSASRPSVGYCGIAGRMSVLFCRSRVHVHLASRCVDAGSNGVYGHSPSQSQLAGRSIRYDRHLRRIYRAQAHTIELTEKNELLAQLSSKLA